MVVGITQEGLIVTASGPMTEPLGELVAYCDWPVLVEPTDRMLLERIESTNPTCLVFWLESRRHVAPTARQIGRLRDRGARPYRVAIAHRLEQDIEPLFRAAGVHSYLSTSGNIGALVANALLPLLNMQRQPARSSRSASLVPQPAIRGPTSVRGSPATMRPP
jgi:hypothetical protein